MTPTETAYERYRADFSSFERTLPAGGPKWVGELRRRAMSRFDEAGFPTATRGNEEWRFSSVGPIARNTFEYPFENGQASITAADVRSVAPWDESWTTLVFVDGRYSGPLSKSPASANGARVGSLADAIVTDGAVVERYLARHADSQADGFTAVNTAFLQDGAFVYIPGDAVHQPPLHLVFLTTNRAKQFVTYPRTLVVVGPNSKLTLVESYVSLSTGTYFTDAVAEIVAGEGAQIEHYRYLRESPQAFHIGMTRVHQSQDSTFSSMSFATGAALARNDLEVLLDGPGSTCTLNGLYMTAGTEHIDNHINIDHAKPHATSTQYFKGILGGRSRAVFSGRVLVRKDAQKTNARQSDKNLLLSEGARVNTKPSLEIFADDVLCAHGATAGAVADEALFYMRTRGLDLATATRLLIQGFAAEVLDTVKLQPFADHLEGLVTDVLPSLLEGA